MSIAVLLLVSVSQTHVHPEAEDGPVRHLRDGVVPAVADRAPPLHPSQVELGGLLGERFRASLEQRLLAIDEDALLAGFEKRPGEQPWIGEHVGKWLDAAARTHGATNDPALAEKIDRVLERLVATQEADGYLGTYLPEKRFGLFENADWDVWVHKYAILGAVADFRYRGEIRGLMAARRAGDLLCETFGTEGARDLVAAGTHAGMAATSVLEAMALLHRVTSEQRYLGFAHRIVARMSEEGGPDIVGDFSRGAGAHEVANAKAYEMLSNLAGLVEFHRMTANSAAIAAARAAWDDIATRHLYPSGSASVGEYFRAPGEFPWTAADHIAETCVTVTWLQFCHHLYALTGEAKYADSIETTIFNHLLAAQHPAGADWCYFTPLEGTKEFRSDINCCHSSGPRGISLLPTLAAHATPGGVGIDLLVPMTIRAELQKHSYALRCAIEPGAPARYSIIFESAEPLDLTIVLRRPHWLETEAVSIGEESTPWPRNAEQFAVTRRLDPGTAISFSLATSPRVIDGAAWNHPGAKALGYGPFLLASPPGEQVSESAISGFDASGLPIGATPFATIGANGEPFVVFRSEPR
jgi:uncharacterized protein